MKIFGTKFDNIESIVAHIKETEKTFENISVLVVFENQKKMAQLLDKNSSPLKQQEIPLQVIEKSQLKNIKINLFSHIVLFSCPFLDSLFSSLTPRTKIIEYVEDLSTKTAFLSSATELVYLPTKLNAKCERTLILLNAYTTYLKEFSAYLENGAVLPYPVFTTHNLNASLIHALNERGIFSCLVDCLLKNEIITTFFKHFSINHKFWEHSFTPSNQQMKFQIELHKADYVKIFSRFMNLFQKHISYYELNCFSTMYYPYIMQMTAHTKEISRLRKGIGAEMMLLITRLGYFGLN